MGGYRENSDKKEEIKSITYDCFNNVVGFEHFTSVFIIQGVVGWMF